MITEPTNFDKSCLCKLGCPVVTPVLSLDAIVSTKPKLLDVGRKYAKEAVNLKLVRFLLDVDDDDPSTKLKSD